MDTIGYIAGALTGAALWFTVRRVLRERDRRRHGRAPEQDSGLFI